MVTVSPLPVALATSSGMPYPALYPQYEDGSALYMFKKNMSDSALAVWPSENFHPFMVMVTVRLWSEKTGAFAIDSGYCTWVEDPRPNQYSGRYMRNWNWLMLATEKYAHPMYGKM